MCLPFSPSERATLFVELVILFAGIVLDLLSTGDMLDPSSRVTDIDTVSLGVIALFVVTGLVLGLCFKEAVLVSCVNVVVCESALADDVIVAETGFVVGDCVSDNPEV